MAQHRAMVQLHRDTNYRLLTAVIVELIDEKVSEPLHNSHENNNNQGCLIYLTNETADPEQHNLTITFLIAFSL